MGVQRPAGRLAAATNHFLGLAAGARRSGEAVGEAWSRGTVVVGWDVFVRGDVGGFRRRISRGDGRDQWRRVGKSWPLRRLDWIENVTKNALHP